MQRKDVGKRLWPKQLWTWREARRPANSSSRTRMSSPALAIQLRQAEMRLLQDLVYQECGMYFDARRTHFLQDRLQRRLRECRMDSFYSYYRLLLSPGGRQELMKLLENLTVNET